MEFLPFDRKKIADISGQRFGKLLVLEPHGIRRYRAGRALYFRCRCDCGNEFLAQRSNLQRIKTPSCGCAVKVRATSGDHAVKHPLYKCWKSMIERTTNPNNKSFKDYGRRGIKVSDRWLTGEDGISGFECFASDMGQKPSSKHSIERMNNDLGYNKDNCSWATKTAQNRNTRKNLHMTFRGKTAPVSVWCKELNLPYYTIIARLNTGWTDERALTTPIRPY